MISITRLQYDAFLAAALNQNLDEVRRIRDIIDAANDVRRYFLYIRWIDVGGTPPARIELGKGWPPEMTTLLELDRPIAREDVDTYLEQNTNNPTEVHVTPDVNGVVGWTELSVYDFLNAP